MHTFTCHRPVSVNRLRVITPGNSQRLRRLQHSFWDRAPKPGPPRSMLAMCMWVHTVPDRLVTPGMPGALHAKNSCHDWCTPF